MQTVVQSRSKVFEGNTGDPTTVAPVIAKLRQRFHLRRVVLVGDRGLLTDACIREELKPVVRFRQARVNLDFP